MIFSPESKGNAFTMTIHKNMNLFFRPSLTTVNQGSGSSMYFANVIALEADCPFLAVFRSFSDIFFSYAFWCLKILFLYKHIFLFVRHETI